MVGPASATNRNAPSMNPQPLPKAVARIAKVGTVQSMIEEKLSVKQAADLACVSKYVIYRMINEGILPAYQPSPRRIWLKESEVREAFAVPVKPRARLPRVPPAVADTPPAAEARPAPSVRRAAKPSVDLSALKASTSAYAHLRRAPSGK